MPLLLTQLKFPFILVGIHGFKFESWIWFWNQTEDVHMTIFRYTMEFMAKGVHGIKPIGNKN